jgi:protein-S-isoprenylcysteine O-methyltransferase Ste14
MHAFDYVIYGLWVIFWLGWLAAARTAKRATRSRMRQLVGLRLALFVIVILVSRSGAFKGHHTIESNPALQGIGLGLFLIGLGLALWARVYLGRNWGTPMSEKTDAELVTTGPYRYIRNPIYSGLILAAVGTAVAVSWYWLVAVVFMGVYFIYSATVEERTMERLFPNDYPAYKRSTKMLIPYVL